MLELAPGRGKESFLERLGPIALLQLVDRLEAEQPAADLKKRYGADTLEQAFFAATGRTFEEEEAVEEEPE